MKQLDLIKSKILTKEALDVQIKKWRLSGETIVFTNGCFDLIHLGHIDYLARAKDLGGKLIVGLNSDRSVSKLKGSKRPIQNQESRSTLLASMQFIDALVLFNDETPIQLINSISPDILVKGGDYIIKEIVGHDWVTRYRGEVVTLKFVPGHSSSKIIEQIIKTNG
jgi:rfaE bifunctional protein nucleotidyltransferase chain/domain